MARGRSENPQSDPEAKPGCPWRMADTLRGSMDAAEYKHVVLGLIFLKYISAPLRGEVRPPRRGAGTRR